MPYDERLAMRVRAVVKGQPAIVEKTMFGGLAYLAKGRMFAGILKSDLVVRVGPEANDAALNKPHTRPMDFTGKPMKGYIFIGPGGVKTATQLRAWLAKGLSFVAGLPPAKPKPPRPTSTTHRRNHRRRTS